MSLYLCDRWYTHMKKYTVSHLNILTSNYIYSIIYRKHTEQKHFDIQRKGVYTIKGDTTYYQGQK